MTSVLNKGLKFLLTGVLFLSFHAEFSAQTTVNYTVPGVGQTWLCPAGVTEVSVQVWGAGGGAGGGGNSNKEGGGGGGGGGYAMMTSVPVTAGLTYTLTVGAGGNGGANLVNGTTGGLSTITFGGITLTGNGGAFGRHGNAIVRAGGNGGTGAIIGGVGTTFTGGIGGNGGTAGAGGGGEGACTTGNGNAGKDENAGGGTDGDGGTGCDGGDGGDGEQGNSADGNPGTAIGGGGGSGTNGSVGGNGARGQVTLVYCVNSTKTFNVAAGNWNVAGNWTPAGIPGVCDNVIIPTGRVCTNTTAANCKNLTIQSGGSLTSSVAITVGGTFTIDNGGTYVHNNTTDPGTTIFAGGESFGPTSTIDVRQWINGATPLGQYAAAFGNIIFQAPLVAWDQDGTFAPNKIKGDVTITNVQVNFDDGTGATTALTIDGSVTTTGTGGIIFQEGANRNLTLVTGSFTHDGTGLAAGMYLSFGILNWTVNGSVSVSDDFTGIEGAGSATAASEVITITNDFNITGGLFDWNRGIDGNITLNVGGNINITGAPGWVRFNDGNSGALTVTCTNFNIAGGVDNDFQKGDGDVSVTCSGNWGVTGGTTHILDILADGNLTFVANSMSQTAGVVEMISDGLGNITNLTCTNTFDMDGGTFYGIDNGTATATGNIVTASFGAIDFDGGNFTLHDGNNTGNGTVTFSVTNNLDVNFTGATNGFGIINVISSGFPTASVNTLLLDLDVGGDLIVSGNTSALFFTSGSSGNEAIDVVGNFTWSGGIKYINGSEAAGSGHNVVLNIGGNATFSGGSGHLSGVNGNITAVVTGNTIISGGTHAIKVLDGTGTYNCTGSFTQTAGTWFHHKSATNSTADVVAVTVGGAFSQTGGLISIDPNTTSTATHTITLNGSSIVVGGTGIITHALPGTGTVFGEIYVNPASGTTTYERNGNHQIDQTRIILNASKILDASASTFNIQIATNDAADDAIPPTTIMLDVLGVLNSGAKVIHGRSESATQRPTSVLVRGNGEIQTANTNGLYNGSTAATLANFSRNSTNADNTINSMNWFLNVNSRITYNGTGNQVVTGDFPANLTTATISDVTLGSNAGYHYYDLEIDHQGTIGTNYVYPAASNVFVRNILDMDRGEFRLDGSGTGFMINIENPATTGITLTGAAGDAYIRSETSLGTNPSIVRWYMETTTGSHVIPFGHSTGAANYVPFTFNVNSGGAVASFVDVSTRSTDDGVLASNRGNIPWESTVTNMFSPNLGGDGSVESVIDRWWQIDVSAVYNADITFTYRGVENTLDAPYSLGNIGAQRWDGSNWQPDNANWGSTPSVTVGTGSVTVPGVVNFSPWILSSVDAPLPAELISFTGKEEENFNRVEWIVASEINVSHYTVQSSQEGDSFEDIGTVQSQGQGNSSVDMKYEYIDYEYFMPETFYRLKIVDYDGKISFSKVVVIDRVKEDEQIDVNVYPNPSNGEFTMDLKMEMKGEVQIRVLNLQGQLIFNEIESAVIGLNKFNYDLSRLANGLYHIEVIQSNYKKTIQYIKN